MEPLPSPLLLNTRITLASASPRRAELLSRIGVGFRVIVPDIDETVRAGETARDYVARMARQKAMQVHRFHQPEEPVLGADTTVVIDGSILGKPADRSEAIAMLTELSGRTHEVWSAVFLVLEDDRLEGRVNISHVTFDVLDIDWIEAYCDSGEPMDKAGAYGIQGFAGQHIRHLEGSYSGVMGLPLWETAELLRWATSLQVNAK